MDTSFDGFRFEPGGGHMGTADDTWAIMEMSFKPIEGGRGYPGLKILIPIGMDPERTLGQHEEMARERAIVILRAALRELEADSVAELSARSEAILRVRSSLIEDGDQG